ncbi:MAG TPA: 6-phosphogluconolactonase [Hydrogenophaga sp.]|uniref:6-phosphogluconolactonase n=1 Tax=Hydrogenophaga sp. TaxID=1904254 RepID=UPI0008D7E4B6|nr:6-phosphogluconolactonase [Hydrogenophaga sp.]MBU4183290.1 6-phosphogluconolactonase [Gammaproteobacteria bacterium]OGA78005.1 MAG: 6-phosphogluconolactonase [Burkholderiales bacterium GWE1_65_30]OGA94356.1 MAG: 6-phosphogluconolactonase [Burkholderiales bacterium GWF1_66_17]PKO78834.1 MAG: 6-phosphogluconolactonase [Betaproteobacteria bacterium HGW-Betaproteobacteria-15]MBU4283116.1 6-phosphogluconolactonase [Gammaproteobacteria bacterium]
MAVTEHPNATPAALAEHIANALRSAIAARGQASLAVSGGKSPIPLFEALREQDLDWSKVTIVLVDERVVPRDHADSNTALVARHLLKGRASAARFLLFFRELAPTFNAEVLDALVRDAEERIRSLPWPLDVAVLGMGEDAHTASLFPGAPGYARAIATDQRLAWVVPDTAPHARISFTLSALLAARELVLSITGESKLAVYRRAAQKADEALPISLVINQTQTPLSVWMN